jgi:hypothetical protein
LRCIFATFSWAGLELWSFRWSCLISVPY